MAEPPRLSPNEKIKQLLQGHALSDIFEVLSQYCMTGSDFISLMTFITFAASLNKAPVFLQIVSSWPGWDGMLVDRILNLIPAKVKQPTTVKELNDLKQIDFEGCSIIWPRHDEARLLLRACELAVGDLNSHEHLPGVLILTQSRALAGPIGPCITLLTPTSSRYLVGCGYLYSSVESDTAQVAKVDLQKLLQQLESSELPTCSFSQHIRSANLSPDESLAFCRVLLAIAALRISWEKTISPVGTEIVQECIVRDYSAARNLMTAIPLAGDDGSLSTRALELASKIHCGLQTGEIVGESIPGHSEFSSDVFNRKQLQEFTGWSYNSIKKYLSQLEDAGIVASTQADAERERGTQIYFRLARSPPFIRRSRFNSLPPAAEIANLCNPNAQS